jgi:hypothetical protein
MARAFWLYGVTPWGHQWLQMGLSLHGECQIVVDPLPLQGGLLNRLTTPPGSLNQGMVAYVTTTGVHDDLTFNRHIIVIPRHRPKEANGLFSICTRHLRM